MIMILALALCIHPGDFGAVPDDGNDDTVAIQKAIDATPVGGDLCIDPGYFAVTRQPLAWNRFAALNYHKKGITVTFAPGASINLVGDQMGKSTIVWAVDPGAEHVTFVDATMTTSGAWNTDEQTHVIATSGECSVPLGTCTPILDLTIRNFTCVHPRGATRTGDCIRLLGLNMATRVIGVLVEDSHLSGGRSCIEFQRGLENVVFRRNVCDGPTADQHADGEASGVTPGMEVKNVAVYDNTFICGPLNQGDYDLSMTSGIGLEVYGNKFCRGIKVVKSTGVHIHHQNIWSIMREGGGKADSEGVIEVSNVCDGLWIHDSTIVRDGLAGPAIRLVGHGTATCSNIVIERVTMIQKTAGFGVYSESASNLTIRDSPMSWTVPAPLVTAIYARGTIAPVAGLSVNGNTIVGQLKAVLALQSTPYPVVSPIALGNLVGGLPMCTGSGCL